MPAVLPDGLAIGAVLPREDPRDALVLPGRRRAAGHASRSCWPRSDQRPAIGTSSVRRIAQLVAAVPGRDASRPIRGNLDTRLRKLDAGSYDALVLAAAGMRRLGFTRPDLVHAAARRVRARAGPGIDRDRDCGPTTRGRARRSRAIDDRVDGAARSRPSARWWPRSAAAARRPSAPSRVPDGDDLDLRAVVVSLDGQPRGPRARPGAADRGRRAGRAAGAAPGGRGRRRDPRRGAAGPGSRPTSPTKPASAIDADTAMKKPIVYLIGAGPGDPWLISVRGLRYLARGRRRASTTTSCTRGCCGTRGPTPSRSTSAPAAPRAARAGSDLLPARREGARGQDGRAAEVGRPVRLRPRRRGSAVPARARRAVRGRARHPGGDRRARRTPASRSPIRAAATRSRSSAATKAEHAKTPHVDWASLAQARRHGRLLLRARSSCPAILEALLSHGWPEDDSGGAHLQRHAARRRRRSQARSASWPRMAKQPKFTDPAILVVGRVAGLREHLRWFDARPLFGKRIVVTRPREQAAELVDALEQLRRRPSIEAPTIRIAPPEDFGAARRGVRERSASSTGSSSPAPTASTPSSSACSPAPATSRALTGVQLVRDRRRRPPSGWRGTA